MKRTCFIASLAVSFSLFQASSAAAETADTKVDIGAMAAIENGQFVKSYYAGSALPYKPWINDEYARISLSATLSDHLRFIVAPEIRMWFDNYDWHQMGAEAFAFPFSSHTTVSLANAQGILSFGDKESRLFEFAAGVMPYKYDNEAKNLGEYLFRSGCHPAYVVTSFDNAYAPLTGFRLSGTMFNKLSLDLLLTTETQFLPTLDWSVSLLAGYKPLPYLEVGAGVMLDRLLPVDSTRESPSGSGNEENRYFTKDRDTAYFSFGGTKVMARFCFDPKEVLNDLFPADIFGKEDMKIYAEAAILGVTSITAYGRVLDPLTGMPVVDTINGMPVDRLGVDSLRQYYADIKQRIPVMVGVNWPTHPLWASIAPGFSIYLLTHKFDLLTYIVGGAGIASGIGLWSLENHIKSKLRLDVLSMEWEWYGWPFPLCYGDVNNFRVMYPVPPIPQSYPGGDALAFKKTDNWKFSVYFKKTLTKGFSIIGQVARDHTHYDAYYTKYNTGYFSTEAFTLTDDWGWWLKLQYAL
jgi:hypothetical protein